MALIWSRSVCRMGSVSYVMEWIINVGTFRARKEEELQWNTPAMQLRTTSNKILARTLCKRRKSAAPGKDTSPEKIRHREELWHSKSIELKMQALLA